ncbi:hypothetical protein J2Z50_006579 [Ensifer mexicanus]|nr:hypothetical protein [Sinorhizobium mexicanum]
MTARFRSASRACWSSGPTSFSRTAGPYRSAAWRTDAEGYGGFNDKVNNHYLKTYGSAALLAIVGTGIDMALPESSTLATQDTASDAARRNFAEAFGRAGHHGSALS